MYLSRKRCVCTELISIFKHSVAVSVRTVSSIEVSLHVLTAKLFKKHGIIE